MDILQIDFHGVQYIIEVTQIKTIYNAELWARVNIPASFTLSDGLPILKCALSNQN